MGDSTRICSVGLLTTDYYDKVESFIQQATEAGHEFVVTPIVHPRYSRVLRAKNNTSWRDNPVYDRDDLVLKQASK